MRKISLVLLSIGALLALSIYWQGPASADGMVPAPPDGFGKKIAGVYMNHFVVPGDPNDPNDDTEGWSMTTIHADGTGQSSNALNEALQSDYHYRWERTGPYTTSWGHLVYGYNADGELTWAGRATGSAEFDPDFETSEGPWVVEVFAGDKLLLFLDNPNTTEPPTALMVGTYTAQRWHPAW